MMKYYPKAENVRKLIVGQRWYVKKYVDIGARAAYGDTVYYVGPSFISTGGPYTVTVEHPSKEGEIFGEQETYYVDREGRRCRVIPRPHPVAQLPH